MGTPALFYPLPILVILVLSQTSPCFGQYISHFNSKGLKGNFTFDLRDETEGTILVIESFIESDQLKWMREHQEGEQGDTPDVSFEWSLHSNTLDPQMLPTCSSDDLGPSVGDKLGEAFLRAKTFTLDKPNQWTIPLRGLLEASSLPSLSSIIWGKSIRLKLAGHYNDQIIQKPKSASPGPSSPSSPLPSPSRGPVIIRPQLAQPASPARSAAPSKPTFAPRPKPNISGRQKPTSAPPRLPRSLALVAEDSSMTSPGPEVGAKPKSESTTPNAISTPVPVNITTDPTDTKAKEKKAAEYKKILRLYGNSVVCGNIIDNRNVKTAQAVFESQVSGRVTIRGNEDDTTLLMVNLYHIRSKVTTRHDWKIMASDILDNRRDDEKCKYLQVLFDPNNIQDSECKRTDMSKCRMGDLTKKHGQIQVAGQGKSTRTTLVDLNLPLSALEGSRSLFMVIYEVATKTSNNGMPSRPSILSCAQIHSVRSRKVEAVFNMDGVRGSFKLSQRHITEPTSISYDLFGLEGNIKHLSIRELPLPYRMSADNSKICSSLGDVFNPTKTVDSTNKDKTTIDMFRAGNFSAKHGHLSVIDSEYEDHYMGESTDLSLQLYGAHSVVGRSILVSKNNGDPWVCATLNYVDEQVSLASATFYYPVVGRISFQQLVDEPHSETGVSVEVYNPNSAKSSEGHNWLVHLKPAMADFYNWSERCFSAGEVYDPIQASIGLSNEVYSRQCQNSMLNEPLRCRSGDTSLKGGFKLTLPVSHLERERHFYTDLFLPLAGPNSILGRSVVIYDEQAPTQRGNRLACSTIKSVHSLKASVKSWNSGPSIPSNVRGSVVFDQEFNTKDTQIKIDLTGLSGNVENYAIHEVWTMEDREFPCSNDSLYDIYDPYDTEHSLKLPPSAHYGSLATVDRVKVGDMSRKHGNFEGLQSVQKSIKDANMPLFAPNSVIGRAVVLRAAVNDFRWVCGNIELDYDKGSSREIIGIASFDEPRSKIAGYVRFFQLEYKDGSLSDTYVQVDLKLQADGIHELETSKNHGWSIFVNQVGEDAYIAADDVRCIASGFKWNPYLAQDSLDSYTNFCNPTEQLGCAMGDLGMRHGPLTLGPNNRISISDSNLPLVGNYSVMGRSLVIFDNKRPSVKLACANIFPDIHLKSNFVIKRTPSFTVARFIEQMRTLLGAAEWLMVPELRATKPVANGECVQMTIHFYGQKAHQMQVELNNLITLGTVRKSTRIGVDKISTHYKLCRAGEMTLTSSASPLLTSINTYLLYYIVIILFFKTI